MRSSEGALKSKTSCFTFNRLVKCPLTVISLRVKQLVLLLIDEVKVSEGKIVTFTSPNQLRLRGLQRKVKEKAKNKKSFGSSSGQEVNGQ